MNIAHYRSVLATVGRIVLILIILGTPQKGRSSEQDQGTALVSQPINQALPNGVNEQIDGGLIILAQTGHELKPRGAAPQPAAEHKASDFVQDGVITYPQPSANLQSTRPVIGADYRGVQGRVPDAKFLLVLDGRDVTASSQITSDYIFHTPGADLAAGRHQALIKMFSPDGESTVIADWTFYVAGSRPLRYAYPSPGGIVDARRPIIGLRFDELPRDLDRQTIRLVLDGKDITASCDFTDEYIFYAPPGSLGTGAHTAAVKVKHAGSGEMETIAWNFTVGQGGAPSSTYAAADTQEPRGKQASAAAIAKTQRQINSIARATHEAEWILGGPPQPEPPETAARTSAQTGPDRPVGDAQAQLPPEQDEEPFEGGFEYAWNTMYGFENMAVDGDQDLSSQRTRNAYLYNFGLRTQTYLQSRPGRGWFINPTLGVNFRMEGTSDGDESESMAMVKNFTATLEDETKRLSMYDINPKYTTYSLTGQRLYGGEFKNQVGENTSYHMFGGKFKNPRAGKDIDIYGGRYDNITQSGMKYGVHYVGTHMKTVRGGVDSSSGLFGIDASKKYAYGETKMEWAQSRYSDLADAMAYRLESTWRKEKAYLTAKYESVGSNFRTEGGFASKGLVEFNSSLQYKNNQRLTTVLGFRRRTFRDGGSHTMSVPVVLKYSPFASKPSTAIEYRYKLTYYDKGDTWKDTFSNEIDIRHVFGSVKSQIGFKKERKLRNLREPEMERLLSLNLRTPIYDKTEFIYSLSKINNNFFGPDSKNVFSVTYELSDWSDMRVAQEYVNKVQPTLDRTTSKLRWGKVNPDTNTEMNFEMMYNNFLLYDETYFTFKYSVFY